MFTTPLFRDRIRAAVAVRTRRLPALLVLTTATAALVGLVGVGTAQAGGTPSASCPSGERVRISNPYDSPYAGKAGYVTAGYYAHIGSFWPPYTKIICRTDKAAHHPARHPRGEGCPAGWRPFGIPNDIPSTFDQNPPVTWGTFLPTGWYILGADGSKWTTVCWSATMPE